MEWDLVFFTNSLLLGYIGGKMLWEGLRGGEETGCLLYTSDAADEL